jgi:hypothetical protein
LKVTASRAHLVVVDAIGQLDLRQILFQASVTEDLTTRFRVMNVVVPRKQKISAFLETKE